VECFCLGSTSVGALTFLSGAVVAVSMQEDSTGLAGTKKG
jgi:hypothetical protein